MKTNFSEPLSTGYKNVDTSLNNIEKGDLIIIAGRPACGKTALSLSIAYNNLIKNKTCLIFSTEMGFLQILQRLNAYQNNDFNPNNKLNAQLKEFIDKNKLFIDDTAIIRASYITQKIKEQQKTGLDLVIIDYLQLLLPSEEYNPNLKFSRTKETGTILKELKQVTKETGIPIIINSMLTRHIYYSQYGELSISALNYVADNFSEYANKAILIKENEEVSQATPNQTTIQIDVYKNTAESTKDNLNLIFYNKTALFNV